MVTIYSHEDRIKQLSELSGALESLCEHLKRTGLFPEMLRVYESYEHNIKTLISTSFSQDDLSELSRSIPDLYNRHKDWCPPLEQTEKGLREPEWFKTLETYLHPVLNSAQILRETGYY